jgi:uracil-DNA glycosylase
MNKIAEYATLVAARKVCHLCRGLTNPVDVDGGRLDSNQIGAWSLWQGNLHASLMVVGQDWGDTGYFVRQKGREGPRNPTNLALVELVGIAGVSIGDPGSQEGRDVAFFTNAILCLKGPSGGLQGTVQQGWFDNCASFLRKQIEIVHPDVVVGLGERAYRAILLGFKMQAGPFRAEVEAKEGRVLPNGTRAFAVYHCGSRIRNTHRTMDAQREDWRRMRSLVTNAGVRR